VEEEKEDVPRTPTTTMTSLEFGVHNSNTQKDVRNDDRGSTHC
jgi:hypothetical protein